MVHRQVMSLLGSSEANTKFTVPYNDVLTNPQAIAASGKSCSPLT